MKPGWETKRLGEVCAIERAQGVYQNLPYVGLENVESQTGRFLGSLEPTQVKSSTFRFSPRNILYGRLRPYLNKVMIPDFCGHCSTEILPLRPSERVSREFLRYWLISDATVSRIDATSTGARMPRADMNSVMQLELLVPPLCEQRRIVGVLDKAFAAIATAKANTEKNLQNAGALIESWFEDQLRELRNQYGGKPLAEVVKSISTGPFGTMLHKSDYVPKGIPLVNPMNIVKGKIVPSADMLVDRRTIERLRPYVLKAGDVVIARRGEMGRCAVVTDQEQGWLCGTGCFFVRLGAHLDSRFFAATFRSSEIKARLQSGSVGTTMSNLNHGILNELPITTPPRAVQESIIDHAEQLSHATVGLEARLAAKIERLDELKRSFLDQAFTGRL